MSKLSKMLIGAVMLCGMALVVSSCSDEQRFLGSWRAVATDDVTPQFSDATSATSRLYLIFENGVGEADGRVIVANEYEMMRPATTADGTALTFAASGRAEMDGSWSVDLDDADDLLLNLNTSAIKVNLDESNVSLAGDAPAGMNVATVDSLKKVVAEKCRIEMHGAMSRYASRMAVIKDLEVSKDGNQIGFEIDDPDRDVRMTRISK